MSDIEYTVKKLAQLAGISARTIRFYDEVDLLKPAKINSSGYRIYGQQEIDILQQIMFYRQLGISLEDIKKIIKSPNFDKVNALKEHHEKLKEKRKQLNILISNVEKTLLSTEGKIKMSDKEKFQGFKQKIVDENEENYGKEAREKYGDDKVNKANKKIMGMTKEQYNEWQQLSFGVMETLKAAFATGDPRGELAQQAAQLHRQWLCYTWESYSKEAHAGLAQTYVDDERFTKYYDKEQPGLAVFLRDAIHIYTSKI